MLRRMVAGAVLAVMNIGLTADAQQLPPQRPQYIPTTLEIEQLLESGTPSLQAWGAWLTAHARATTLVPKVRGVADRYRAAKDWREASVTRAALDALIQMQASVPAAWSRTFLDAWPAQTMILLTHAGDEAGPALLDVLRQKRGVVWLAAANRLLALKTSGFAAHLLEDVEITASVFIQKDASQSGVSMGGVDASVDHGAVARLPGFPPLASYYLSSAPNPGGVVLATGPVTIYYFRNVSQPGETAVPTWHDQTAPRAEHRLQYAWALLGMSGRTGLLRDPESRSIVWTDQKSLDLEVATFKAELERRFRGLVQQLVTGRMLTAAEASALPPLKISIQIHDRR